MNAVWSAAREVVDWLDERGISSCLIGGLAVLRWGEPRFTRDVDLTVLAPFGEETAVIDSCLARFDGRIPDAREFASTRRILLLKASNGVPVDIALGAIDFEIESLRRATPYEFESGVTVRTCSAEDLIVHKSVAARPQDLVDMKGVVNRQVENLDVALIRRWLQIFGDLKEDPDIGRPFEDFLRRAQAAVRRR
jgi:predicted nucleotidyltransferase